MLLSMDSAISALSQFQVALNVTANNIANVNTVGFKSATVNFEDAFSQTVGSGSSGSTQVGTGVKTASIQNQFASGSLTSTNSPTDMAIDNSAGFFVVKDPGNGNTYATRDGNFHVDSSGYLTTSGGLRVQGYTDSSLTTVGDIKVDTIGAPTTDTTLTNTAAVATISFSADGKLRETLSDTAGTTVTRGQILLQNFTSPQQLVKVGNNLYFGLSDAGPLAAPLPPGTNGLGKVQTNTLEMSNVDLAAQLTALITTQRAYEANGKVVTTSNDILQTLVNLKQG